MITINNVVHKPQLRTHIIKEYDCTHCPLTLTELHIANLDHLKKQPITDTLVPSSFVNQFKAHRNKSKSPLLVAKH